MYVLGVHDLDVIENRRIAKKSNIFLGLLRTSTVPERSWSAPSLTGNIKSGCTDTDTLKPTGNTLTESRWKATVTLPFPRQGATIETSTQSCNPTKEERHPHREDQTPLEYKKLAEWRSENLPIFLKTPMQSRGHRGHHGRGHFYHGLPAGIFHHHRSNSWRQSSESTYASREVQHLLQKTDQSVRVAFLKMSSNRQSKNDTSNRRCTHIPTHNASIFSVFAFRTF